MLRKIIKFVFCKFLFKVKYYNVNMEKNIESCVVCSNHLSASDPFFLYANSKNLAIMAKAELFSFKPFGYILKKCGVFPIKRGEKDAKSIMHAVNVFKDNKSRKLLIFPEGTRVKDGKRVPGKIGAAYVALKAGVPVLPVRIIKENPNKTFFTKIYVVYGDPIHIENENSKDKEYLKKVTSEIMEKIYALNKPEEQLNIEKIETKKNKPKKQKIKIQK